MTLTFKQFQATRKPCADLGAALSDARWEDEPIPAKGMLYCDCLYIQDMWPAAPGCRWNLLLDRSDFISDDLDLLERKLYEFAVSEGYCD